MSNDWLGFWKDKNAFDDSMAINYSYFLKKVECYIQPSAEAIVLDIGSGPGNLEDAWYKRVKEIHGVDISERYNQIGREKHKEHPNVFFHDLPENEYLNFSMLGNKKFDIVIVMSVLQYYSNKNEVIQLIKIIKQIVAPGAVVLLCDLIVKESFIKEVLHVLSNSIKERKFFSTLNLFFRLRFSNYHKVKKTTGFLVLSEKEWRDIMNQLQLKAVFLDEAITLQKDRKNIIIQFNN